MKQKIIESLFFVLKKNPTIQIFSFLGAIVCSLYKPCSCAEVSLSFVPFTLQSSHQVQKYIRKLPFHLNQCSVVIVVMCKLWDALNYF